MNNKNNNLIEQVAKKVYNYIWQRGYKQGLKDNEAWQKGFEEGGKQAKAELHKLEIKNKTQRTKIRTMQKELKNLKGLLKNWGIGKNE